MPDLLLTLAEFFVIFVVLVSLPPDDSADADARFEQFKRWFR